MNSKIMIILDSYQKHLELQYSLQHKKKFCERRKNNPEAAISEAIIFNWLKQINLNPSLLEDKSKGGPDFLCKHLEKDMFAVEVTCLQSEDFTSATNLGLENSFIAVDWEKAFKKIRTKVSAKAKQMSRTNMPRVLCLVSNLQPFAQVFLSEPFSSFCFAIPSLNLPIDKTEESNFTYNLQESMFFRINKNSLEIEYCRESVSAVILVTVNADTLITTGYLHPNPSYRFRFESMPEVPFFRIENDIVKEKQILIGQVNTNSPSKSFPLNISL